MCKRFSLFALFIVFIGCSASDKYVDFVKDSSFLLTDIKSQTVFDKCFAAYQLHSYRDKSDGCIYVRLDGKFIYNDEIHSAQIYYRFTDKTHYTITEFVIDNQTEPDVFFMYYISQLYNDVTEDRQ